MSTAPVPCPLPASAQGQAPAWSTVTACQGLQWEGSCLLCPSHLYLSGHPFTYFALLWRVKSRKFPAAGVMVTYRSTQGGAEVATLVFVQGELGSTFGMHRAVVQTAKINGNYLCGLGSYTTKFCFELVALKYFCNRAVP